MDPKEMSTAGLAEEVVHRRRLIDAAESLWLALLVEFDRRRGWAADGSLSAVEWLTVQCGMARSTAMEKLRIGYQLDRRPLLAEAYATGGLSYSKVRAMTRIVDADEDTDRALLEVAVSGTAADLDVVVREWQLLKEQEQSPEKAMARWERRGLRHRQRYDGNGEITIVAPVEHTERLVAAVDAYLRRTRAVEVSPAGDARSDPVAWTSWAQRRADALVDLVEETVARLVDDRVVDIESCLANVLIDYERLVEKAALGVAELSDGVTLTGEAARRLACDAGVVRIITKGRSEVLDVGQKTQQWSRAQRRAILARHGNRCAIRGCWRKVLQIHHTHPYSQGGDTDVDLGIPLCYGHHHLVHEGGWTATYDPGTGTTTLVSPTGARRIDSALPWHMKRAA